MSWFTWRQLVNTSSCDAGTNAPQLIGALSWGCGHVVFSGKLWSLGFLILVNVSLSVAIFRLKLPKTVKPARAVLVHAFTHRCCSTSWGFDKRLLQFIDSWIRGLSVATKRFLLCSLLWQATQSAFVLNVSLTAALLPHQLSVLASPSYKNIGSNPMFHLSSERCKAN